MGGEAEIRQKIEGYEAMLAGIGLGKPIGNPAVFLAVNQHFPEVAMELLKTSSMRDETLYTLPPEERSWTKQRFRLPEISARWALEEVTALSIATQYRDQ
jgi:hypothetical protein